VGRCCVSPALDPRCVPSQVSSFSMHMSGALLLESRDGDTLDVHLRRTAARVTAEERAAEQSGAAERPAPEQPQGDVGAGSPIGDDGATGEGVCGQEIMDAHGRAAAMASCAASADLHLCVQAAGTTPVLRTMTISTMARLSGTEVRQRNAASCAMWCH